MSKAPPMPDDVKEAFRAFPKEARMRLTWARTQIYESAAVSGAGALTETLKWGQPAYLTKVTKAGSTVRLGLHQGHPALFFNCQTSLVEGFRADFPEAFTYVGNRAALLDDMSEAEVLGICLARAMTYHRNKRRRR